MTLRATVLVLASSLVLALPVTAARDLLQADVRALTPQTEVSAALTRHIRVSAALAEQLAGPDVSATERSDLAVLYGAWPHTPLWVDANGLPTPAARDAVALVRDARADGLDPGDYAAPCVAAFAAAALARAGDAEVAPERAAVFDVALSRAMLRYLRHLHLGRMLPHSLGFRFAGVSHTGQFPALLRRAAGDARVGAVARELWPQSPQYARLRAALASYRKLAADRSIVAPAATVKSVHPGDVYPHAAALRHQLIALGDLRAADAAADTYSGALVEGLRAFQQRHGLTPDGVIGRRTQAALEVPMRARAQQIELAMERLRWLPDLGNERVVTVNIPTFELRGWERLGPDEQPAVASKVITGRAIATETPMFSAVMRSVVFRPFWNVPRSIILKETLPAIARRPGYLDANEMEIVDARGRAVPQSDDSLARVRAGEYGLRQRPGPSNALGLIKFDLPNPYDVYMHSTPAPALFGQSRRDFSHGCVRVEDAIALAEWVFAGEADWPREQIVAAMQGDETRYVPLARPVHVVMFYVTAIVQPDGTVRFAEDIYGHDARLAQALGLTSHF